MRRLYRKIYLTIVVSLVLVVAIAGIAWRLGSDGAPMSQAFEMAGELAASALPPAAAPRTVQQEAIERLALRLDVDLALFDRSLAPIGSFGAPLPVPRGRLDGGGWVYGAGGPAWSFLLPDGRWLVARAPPRHRNPAVRFVIFLGVIALVVAACAFPVVRGLTRRLERLQAGVETLGAGQFGTRVEVEGKDEVAQLAASFNRAATRIEELVNAHRLLLANASHELRTPLARIRLGVEMLQKTGEDSYKNALTQDIAELDALIDEILLASRLDAIDAVQVSESIDLLALVAEECARYERCKLDGDPIVLRGDPRLLRRLLRNLLENASRHGKPPILVQLRREPGKAVIDVLDAGPGIPEAERERVFAPFYRAAGEGVKGAGLGLSLVRQIARLHGGDAQVVAAGTMNGFRVLLPLA